MEEKRLVENKDNPTLCLGGCAGLHHMMFGIGAYIDEHYKLDGVNLKSISGSNFVCACMLSDVSTRSVWYCWSMRMTNLLKKYPLTYFFRLYPMTEAHTSEILTNGKLRNHYVLISYMYRWKREWINEFRSSLDYAKCCVAGAFIPLLVTLLRLRYYFRGSACMDGGLTCIPILNKHNVPKTDLRIYTSGFTKIISKFTWWIWLFKGMCSTHQHHKIQFETGYKYAEIYLKPALDRLLINEPSPPNHKTYKHEWNGTTFI